MRCSEERSLRPASDLTHFDVRDDPALATEVDQRLACRTRDIRLRGNINRLFRARAWSQTAKVIRAWMIWVASLDVLTLAWIGVPVRPRASMQVPHSKICPLPADTPQHALDIIVAVGDLLAGLRCHNRIGHEEHGNGGRWLALGERES